MATNIDVTLQNDTQPEGGLFVQSLQIRTKSTIGSDKMITLKFTSDGGKYVMDTSKRVTKCNTVTFTKRADSNALTHELQIKLSDQVQYKVEGCIADDWTSAAVDSCAPDSDGYTTWNIRKNFTETDNSLLVTCNEQIMIDLDLSDCSSTWARSMHSFSFMDGIGSITDGFYRQPPGKKFEIVQRFTWNLLVF